MCIYIEASRMLVGALFILVPTVHLLVRNCLPMDDTALIYQTVKTSEEFYFFLSVFHLV